MHPSPTEAIVYIDSFANKDLGDILARLLRQYETIDTLTIYNSERDIIIDEVRI